MVLDDIHPSLLKRKIIHIDMDAFFAAVEMRENPELIGKPVVIGGNPSGRGVVSTANYEARKYGIHSAMPAAHAARLCPHAIFIRGHFALYKEASQRIREVMSQFTTLIEPLSLDEAYLDVTEIAQKTSATEVAKHIQKGILEATKLTASAGVAPNKMLAKIASDYQKPHGLTVIKPHQVAAFMENLSVSKIPGVGRVSSQKLADLGIHVCSDVEEYKDVLMDGSKFGAWLLKRARGIDEREVKVSRTRKSVGHETTFSKDLTDIRKMYECLGDISQQLEHRLKKARVKGRTITLKVKYSDFTLITKRQSLRSYTNEANEIIHIACKLLSKTDASKRKVRLLGLSLANLDNQDKHYIQPSMFND